MLSLHVKDMNTIYANLNLTEDIMKDFRKAIFGNVLKERYRPADFSLEKTLIRENKKDAKNDPSSGGQNKTMCYYCKHMLAERYCGVCMKDYCLICAHKVCKDSSGMYS